MATANVSVEFGKFGKKFSDPRFASQLLSEAYAVEAKKRILETIKKAAPVGKHFDVHGNPGTESQWGRPGELRDSLYSTTMHARGHTQLMFKSKIEQAVFVIGGTKPHTINSSTAPFLQFWWENQGKSFPIDMWNDHSYSGSGQSVLHPGQKPNPFVKRAWMSIRATELALFRAAIKKQLGV